jgi:hypothetical protein
MTYLYADSFRSIHLFSSALSTCKRTLLCLFQQVNESPESLKYIWYPELEIYGLEIFGRQRVLKEMSGVRIRKNKTINYELGCVHRGATSPNEHFWLMNILIHECLGLKMYLSKNVFVNKRRDEQTSLLTNFWVKRTLQVSIFPLVGTSCRPYIYSVQE